MYRRLFLLFVLSCPAAAQTAPRFSGSLALGPSTTVGGEFQSADGVLTELSATARIANISRVSLLGTLSLGRIGGIGGDVIDICIPRTYGGCRPATATMSGLTLRLGAESPLGPHLRVGASLGAGWYGSGNSGPGGAHVVPFDVTAIVPVFARIALLGRAERMEFRDYGGEHFHSNALLVGVRVH